MRRIDHQHIDAGIDQRASAIPIVRRANRGSDAQSAVLILVGIRKIAPLVDVLYRDQSTQRTLLVDHRQLLDAMLAEYRLGFVECSPDGGGDEILRGHRLAQWTIEIPLELEVAVGDDSDELSVAIHDWNAGDLEAPHQRHRFAERSFGRERDRIEDHSAFGSFHAIDLGGLSIDRHVLVNDADSTGPGHCHRHFGFGDGVHRRG